MATAHAILPIVVIVISFLSGYAFFYIISDLSKNEKRKHIETMTSQLINFVLLIWLGKIVLNISLFLKDPLVILAYPSNSYTFYFAIICSTMIIFYQSHKGKVNGYAFIHAFIPVFLVASFAYEFMQVVWRGNTYSFDYLIVLLGLVVLFMFIHDRLSRQSLLMVMFIGWMGSIGILAVIKPFVTVFGYIMAPWFLCLFFVGNLIFLLFHRESREVK